MKTIVYTAAARRALREHANRADLILTKIAHYAAAPETQANNSKKLKGRPDYRLRVGNVRIVFSESENTMTVHDIGPRDSICEGNTMTKVRKITSPNGEDMVLLSVPEYERLVEAAEDLEDSEIAERSRREIEAGTEEFLTHAEVTQALAAKTPLAFWRKKRDLTQAALADAAGISQAFLSEIESGQKPGTAATLKKIADALRIKVDDLL
jgi:DNA-binding XRE family transcriptional regulator/mRNA-degrading endonuclease RelE of RelBE toxin-antitoxin system